MFWEEKYSSYGMSIIFSELICNRKTLKDTCSIVYMSGKIIWKYLKSKERNRRDLGSDIRLRYSNAFNFNFIKCL